MAWAGALDLGLARGARAELALSVGASVLLAVFCVALAVLVGSVGWALLARTGRDVLQGSEQEVLEQAAQGDEEAVAKPSGPLRVQLRAAEAPGHYANATSTPPGLLPLSLPGLIPTRRRVVVLASVIPPTYDAASARLDAPSLLAATVEREAVAAALHPFSARRNAVPMSAELPLAA